MFSYKGILLLFGILLAYETRSIKVKQVNDSRFVGMSIYNIVVGVGCKDTVVKGACNYYDIVDIHV